MRPTKLILKNFLSFKELSYDFESFPILVQGENATEDSQESNGSGKSSLSSAIEYAYLKTTIKQTDTDLIFWGEEEADIHLETYCPIRNETLIIDRKIKVKGSGTLKIHVLNFLSGKSVPQSFATVLDGNKFIMNWIDISKEDLLNYFIITKERYKSFFSSTNKEKIEMINRFSNAKLIDGIGDIVLEDVTKLEDEVKIYKNSQTSILSKIRTLNEQVTYELNRDLAQEISDEVLEFEKSIEEHKGVIDFFKEKIEDKKLLIEAVKKSIPESEKSIKNLNLQIKEKSDTLSEVEQSLIELNKWTNDPEQFELETKVQSITSDQLKLSAQKKTSSRTQSEIEGLLQEINLNITGAVKCPKCNHEFLVGDPDVDIEEEKQSKVETEAVLDKVKKSIDSINLELEKLEVETSKLDQEKSVLQKEENLVYVTKREIKTKILNIELDIKTLNKSINECNVAISEVTTKIEKYNREIVNIEENIVDENVAIEKIKASIIAVKEKDIDRKRIADLKVQMKNEGSKLRDINYSLRRKKDQVFETSQWIVNFKRFNMHLANTSLKIIQGYCNKFLQSIKSDIQVRWEGVKMLSDGKLKEEITAYPIRDGVTRNFWTFSGGERVRMDYSMILTLQRMINSTHKYGGLDFLSLDEVGEGLDALGLQDLMKSLSTLDKTILITTHVVNRAVSDRILLVRKEGGASTIVR